MLFPCNSIIYFVILITMFNSYSPDNFSEEIIKILDKANFSVELLICEKDLIHISKKLLKIVENNISCTVIVNSNSKKKSLRLYNLINRLCDCGVEVYWNIDDKIFKLESYFLIVDKTFLINKVFYSDGEQSDNQVMFFNNIFKEICNVSEQVFFSNDELQIKFESSKTIVKKNETITISWDVKNAVFCKIEPQFEEIEFSGFEKIQLNKDTLFKITARNKKYTLTKFLFIRVLKNFHFDVDVQVYDPIIKESLFLNPNFINGVETYVCYFRQSISIIWNKKSDVIVTEKKLGKIKNDGIFKTNVLKNLHFKFKYNFEGSNYIKELKIVSNSDEENKSIIEKMKKRYVFK